MERGERNDGQSETECIDAFLEYCERGEATKNDSQSAD